MTILINGVHHSQEYVEAAVRYTEADRQCRLLWKHPEGRGLPELARFIHKKAEACDRFDCLAAQEETTEGTDHANK